MKSLNEWMDSHDITPEQASDFFGKSVGTIRNWRSAGVPRNQREWVEKRITEWTGRPLPILPDRITVEASREQFRGWNKASLAAGQLIDEWAVDALYLAAQSSGIEQGHADEPPPSTATSAASSTAPSPTAIISASASSSTKPPPAP